MYLRISFELYLKRLLVGNLERVYEIGRDFRNEGVSFKHNPEFTQLEFYWAYADYLQVMELTEQMVSHAVQRCSARRRSPTRDSELDFTPPWQRLELRTGLMEASGHRYRRAPDGRDALRKALDARPDKAPDPKADARQADRLPAERVPRAEPDPADVPVRLSARYLAAGEVQAGRPA